MLCIGLLIHNCYLVIFTGKRTEQFFIDKVLYNGRKTQIVYSTIFPTSAPQIRRYRQEG